MDIKRLVEIDIESDEWFDAPEEHDDQTETSIQQSYVTVLKEEDIRKRMNKEIQSVSYIYLISEVEATLLLPHFRWDVSEFNKQWFDDAKSVRESVGLLERSLDSDSDDKEFFCGVCYESHSLEKSASVSCGHRVCISCWKSHINNNINEIPASDWSWTLKCPYESCPASVGRDMIERFASVEGKTKYDRYLFRSYVDGRKWVQRSMFGKPIGGRFILLESRVKSANEQDGENSSTDDLSYKLMKCCPSPGRSCATDLTGVSDVFCLCLLSFCWNCSKDVHRPVDCKSAAKWLAMENSDYQNPNWVQENTVPCPRCKRRIQENQDCSLKMKCLPPCNYDFCWRCRGEWTEHKEETGGDLYTCTHVTVSYEESGFQKAESAADRYKDCYENWKTNESLMQQAKAKLQQLHTDLIPDLSNTQLATVPQLEFIAEAWSQIIECRRVLKWTYAYEYYLREDEVEKLAFLKHKQDDAEIPLEKLCYYAEDKLNTFLDAEGSSEDFTTFSYKLTRLTSITRNHYERLVRDLEDGLTNVVPASRLQRHSEDASDSGRNHEDYSRIIVDY